MTQTSGTTAIEKDVFYNIRLNINRLKLHKAIVKELQGYLEKMVKYSLGQECMFEVEQFQNKFIVYSEVADRLIKELKLVRNRLRDIEEGQINESVDIPMSFYKSVQKRTKEYFDFVNTLAEDFLKFYSLYHKSDNHIF